MEKIIWEVQFTSLPKVKKYCKKCGDKSDFVSSELFRVNANKQNIDIWLIYKCEECKTTWKQEIFSRINPRDISLELLEKFHSNDKDLARHYAMDISRLQDCEVSNPTYQIIGENVDVFDGSDFEITLISPFEFNIKVSSIIKEKLGLTGSQLEKLVSSKRITCKSNKNIKKCRLQKEQVIKINI